MSLKATINLLRSSSFRFALLTGFTIWLATSVVLILVYFKLENTIWQSIDKNLDEQTEQILAQAVKQPDVSVEELVEAFNFMSRTNSMTFETNGMNMMAMHNSPAMKSLHSAMGVANPPNHMIDDNQALTSNQGNLQFTREVTLPSGQIISISQNIDYLDQLQTSLWQSLLFGLSITLLIAFAGALLLTQRSLRRIHEINLACKTIMQGNLNHRVPYKNTTDRFDDYDQMASVINSMLDEINDLIAKVRHVSDNIAHDLKSPLARLRAQLELASSELNSPFLDEGINEVDRLLAMIKSLLGIARIESKKKENFETIDMLTIANDVVEMYRPAFEDKKISLHLDAESGKIRANKNLLSQALANLMDNALKFTPERGAVSITGALIDNRDYKLSIQDSGPGVPEKEMTRVFERFYREDSARDTSGFGLGLSLVEAIINLHEGTIKLSNNEGLLVRLTLPKSS
ncbi:sensor histidine kinase [Reinekea sp.]|jgi:signal transduction histidine kinase|uniref:sensor histidine kinase n=1 Tax=Reinekea sp. TaxID=1970455 RepID=UPI0039894CB8